MATIRTDLIQDSERRLSAAAARRLISDVRAIDRRYNKPSREQLQARRRTLQAQLPNSSRANVVFERILDGNDLTPIAYLEMGARAAQAVCRIQLAGPHGNRLFGTGFLVAPGVVMTNHHVISDADQAAGASAEFNYELDSRGNEKPTARHRLRPAELFLADKSLDFALIAVEPEADAGGFQLDQFGWLPLSADPGKAIVGEFLSIIQHPGGERKQVCVRENKLLRYGEQTLWYQADTVSGSSGSPVFNPFWQVVALHHAGVPKKDSRGRILKVDGKPANHNTDERDVYWIANEGIRVSRIVEFLRKSRLATHSLVQRVLNATPPPDPQSAGAGLAPRLPPPQVPADLFAEYAPDGTSLIIPVRIPLPVVLRPDFKPPVPDTPHPATTGANGAATPAAVIHRVPGSSVSPGLESRTGYNSHFLGGGVLTLELPEIPPSIVPELAPRLDGLHASSPELTYWHASVFYHAGRRLPFLAAVNVLPDRSPQPVDSVAESWSIDPRLEASLQSSKALNGRKPVLVPRPLIPRHCMARRSGETALPTDSDDGKFVPNRIPLAPGAETTFDLWNRIETWLLSRQPVEQRRLSMLCGPLLDGPLTKPDGQLHSNLRRASDPVIEGLAIPRVYWKLLAVPRDDTLEIYGFLFSQQELLDPSPRRTRSKAVRTAHLFQVSPDLVSRLTGLTFGLGPATVNSGSPEKIRALNSLSDIQP